MPARVIACLFAFCSFLACLAYGVWLDQPLETMLLNAMVVMLACYAVGRVGGYVAQRGVDDHIERFKQQNPLPDENYFEASSEPVDTPSNLEAT